MRRILTIVVAATIAMGVSSCCKKKSKGSSAKGTSTATAMATARHVNAGGVERLNYPNTHQGARLLVEAFVRPGADRRTMTKALRPSTEDYEAIFVADAVPKARKWYEHLWLTQDPVISPKPGQTRVLIWGATTEELRSHTGDSRMFPGGYKSIAQKLKPGLTFYRFKFVEPGKRWGMAYDGLVYVNGHWVIVPKPYRALR